MTNDTTVRRAAVATALLLLAGVAASPVAAQEATDPAADAISIELNKMEKGTGGCRSFMVLHNGTQRHFDTLQLDLVLFDPDEIIVDQLAVDMAPLSRGKTMVKVFEIAGHECEDFGRILLNDVLACKGGEETWTDCLALLAPSSRAAIPFAE
jgi:hypothetical protein